MGYLANYMPLPGAYWPGGQPGTARCAFCKTWIMPPLELETLRLRAADSETNKTCNCKFNTNDNANLRIVELIIFIH